MVQFKWIKMSLFVILVLLFTAVTGQNSSFTVRVGDEVTLPCENVIKNQNKCDSTTWIIWGSSGGTARELVTLGKISQTGISKDISDRLNVTENCSLVIKKVTDKDVGRYTCRQFISGQQQGPDSQVDLSVINIEKQQYNDTVILICAVLTYGRCGHTVKWLYDEKDKNVLDTLDTVCSSKVTFTTHLNQKSNYYELFKCNVTDAKRGQTLLCDVGPQSSCEKTGSKGNNKTAEDDTSTQGSDLTSLSLSLSLSLSPSCSLSSLSHLFLSLSPLFVSLSNPPSLSLSLLFLSSPSLSLSLLCSSLSLSSVSLALSSVSLAVSLSSVSHPPPSHSFSLSPSCSLSHLFLSLSLSLSSF
ncbi:uncharacterized protein LOC127360611 isoform X4 [Dicentrarchus labrax]|uniref:uncharacterized protein LOC127360611 isoform X4 n=1 Tax=Dicentrarchus labrax TaxID=13489 RepID=UPI0021F52AC1|nr:uncharacterized protein LOC127360611 isoform X4 [Dicentrarchus labrax]